MATMARPPERARVSERIFDDMRARIVAGEFSRRTRLPTEKNLAERYAVSAPTIREAVRGLSVLGLVEVRHGSGAYVVADGESLVAMSLATVMQLETVGVADALGILSVLNGHAAVLATRNATAADLRRLRETANALSEVDDADHAAIGVRAFHDALAKASHNPLLEVICGFLAKLQIDFARKLAQGSVDGWRIILYGLAEDRDQLVNAIERRDARKAALVATRFHDLAIKLIASLPRAAETRITDPDLRALLAEILADMSPHS